MNHKHMKYVVRNNNKFEANLRFKNRLIGDIQKESYRLLGKNLAQLMSNKMNWFYNAYKDYAQLI